MSNGVKENEEEGFVIKVRGLPWSTTVDEILKFFSECSITHGKAGIHMTMSREGRPSGEAYIEMDSEEDIEKACKRDRDHMGHRYIEVFRAKRGEMEWVVKRSGLNLENAMDDGCVRLRGLPFGCSKEEIAQFFSGLEILPNGISLPTDYTGRSTGEAYVQFVNKDVAERALQKHKEKIGHRYIEIFRSSLSEVRASIGPKMRGGPMGGFNQRPAPYDRGSRFGGMNRFNNNMRGGNRGMNRDFDNGPMWNNGNNFPPRGNMMRGGGGGGGMGPMDMKEPNMGNFRGNDSWSDNMMDRGRGPLPRIHMRGLPFRATEQDIADFFRPVVPVDIRIIFENGGRASGEADVEFATHEEAVRAMSKDRSHMSHRYIELFLNSPGIGGGAGNGGGNMMGGGPVGGRMDNMGGPGGRMDNMGGPAGRMDNMGGPGGRMDNIGGLPGRMDNMGGPGNRMDNMGPGRMDNMSGPGRMDNMSGPGNRMDNMGPGRMDNIGGGSGGILGGIGSFCGGSGGGGGMGNNFRSGGGPGNVNYPIRGGGGSGGGGGYGGNNMNSGNYNNY